jgi:hypothetical protein
VVCKKKIWETLQEVVSEMKIRHGSDIVFSFVSALTCIG